MRLKRDDQTYFNFSNPSSVKVVREHHEKYDRISAILDANPTLLDPAHRDLARHLSSSKGGRSGAYTTEQVIRSLMVMFIEGESYRMKDRIEV